VKFDGRGPGGKSRLLPLWFKHGAGRRGGGLYLPFCGKGGRNYKGPFLAALIMAWLKEEQRREEALLENDGNQGESTLVEGAMGCFVASRSGKSTSGDKEKKNKEGKKRRKDRIPPPGN